MPRQLFVDKNFRPPTLAIIEQANRIIAEYQAQGFTLTLRQLYYQFVARDLIPNNQRSYKRLGGILNDARLAGLVDWLSIEDRTRSLKTHSAWETPAEIIETCASGYQIDLWEGQDNRVEVWIEKDALVGVIEPVCRELRLPYFACRGYTSQSEQWRAGRRFMRYNQDEQHPIVLHFGDHDPSGIDMTRDNQARLNMFSQHGVEVRRLALNMDQVREHGPPPNPAKLTDSRADGYIAEYGDESWELDALEPRAIDQLIRDEVADLVDQDMWEEREQEEREGRNLLEVASERWSDLVTFLNE